VNAAFLLVTTAWLAGADTAAPAAKPAPLPAAAPVATAPVVSTADGNCGGSCGGGCGESCCESGPSFFERLKARFHHNSCGCETSCGCGATQSYTGGCGCESGCGGGHRFFSGGFHGSSSCGCGTTSTCGSCGTSSDCGCESGCGHHGGGLFSRLFHHRSEECGCGGDTGCGCGSYGGSSVGAYGAPVVTPVPTGTTAPKVEPIPAPKDGARPMPTDTKPKGSSAISTPPALENVNPKSTLGVETETKSPFELRRQYESRVGHAADYSWVTGQLFYVHADGGLWVLRYAPVWKEDPNGGSLVLARDLRMDTYREGDLVTVHGEIVSPKSSMFLGGPLYQAQAIQLEDRPAQ
jgi:hypothetical protein